MPMRSKAQNRFMHAAASSPKTARKLGIPQKTAQKFVSESSGQKVRNLPERTRKFAKGGFVRDDDRDMTPQELAQASLNMTSARGNAAVIEDLDSPTYGGRGNRRAGRERTQDIDNYHDTWGEMPARGKGVLLPKERRARVQTQPERSHKAPKGYSQGGSVTSNADKPSCKW